MPSTVKRCNTLAYLVITRRNGDKVFFTIDLADAETVGAHNWCVLAGNKTYAYRKDEDGKNVYLHRWLLHCPEDKQIDHIDGDTLDNRRQNMRIVAPNENRKNHTTKGSVRQTSSGRWSAQSQGKHLGTYSTQVLASYVASRAARAANAARIEEIRAAQ